MAPELASDESEPARPKVGGRLSGRSLELRGVWKSYPGQVALAGVDFDVHSDEVHALVGQNGSGKSTLIKLLSGYHRADHFDSARVGGEAFELGEPGASDRLGLRFVHQQLGLVETMSALENCALTRGFITGWGQRIKWRAERLRLSKLFDAFGVDVDPNVPVASLRPAQRTLVAVARALQDWEEDAVRLLVLDEPTSTLPPGDVRRLLDLIRRVREAGISAILVSHRLSEVFEIADRVTVFRDGRRVITAEVEALDYDGLVTAMIGHPLTRVRALRQAQASEEIMRVTELKSATCRSVSFALRRGEILGITGPLGSGRDDLPALLFGSEERDGGTVDVLGRSAAESPPASIGAGVVMVPADRAGQGSFGDLTVRENMSIVRLSAFVRGGVLRRSRERTSAMNWISDLDIRPANAEASFSSLSGGNQQKVVLAKWLLTTPTVLVLDEPTQGVDVGTKSAIYEILRESAAKGLGVVICGSDSEELATVCDRVLILSRGRIVAELSGEVLTPEEIDEAVLKPAKEDIG